MTQPASSADRAVMLKKANDPFSTDCQCQTLLRTTGSPSLAGSGIHSIHGAALLKLSVAWIHVGLARGSPVLGRTGPECRT